MTRIELPDEAWAVLASPRKVPERKRERVRQAYFALNEGTEGFALANQKIGATHEGLLSATVHQRILALVREWSYGPVTVDVLLDEIPGDAFDQLAQTTEPMLAELMPDFTADPDPKAPTGGSTPAPTVSSTAATSTFATLSTDGTS